MGHCINKTDMPFFFNYFFCVHYITNFAWKKICGGYFEPRPSSTFMFTFTYLLFMYILRTYYMLREKLLFFEAYNVYEYIHIWSFIHRALLISNLKVFFADIGITCYIVEKEVASLIICYQFFCSWTNGGNVFSYTFEFLQILFWKKYIYHT